MTVSWKKKAPARRSLNLHRPIPRRKIAANKRPLLLVLSLVGLLAFSCAAYLIFHRTGPPPKKTAASPSLSWAQWLKLPAPYSERQEVIPPGQTLAGILSAYGFGPADVHNLMEQSRSVFDLSSIKAGREMRFYQDPQGRLEVIEYDINDTDFLRLRRSGGIFRAEVLKFPVEIRLAAVEGQIEDFLINSFDRAGENGLLALDFAEIFAWDVYFYIDPQRGDRFRVLFEKKFKCGRPAGYGNILAAEFWNQGRRLQAFRFTYPDTGQTDYFDESGHSLRKEFLKSPLKFSRITSRFTSSRFNPVSKIYRPHYGVDYAAPVGTPVRATADGKVLTAGWSGGAGRLVTLQHKAGYETMYLHLSSFGEGIGAGAQVLSGQVIGYVGTSGDSTGPHLDYRILQHGKYINPLASRFNPAQPLRPEFRKPFDRQTAEYNLVLDINVLPGRAVAFLSGLFFH
jgi:murein DD-endopeptidase MepM/ murein hydrolase activator NlpD